MNFAFQCTTTCIESLLCISLPSTHPASLPGRGRTRSDSSALDEEDVDLDETLLSSYPTTTPPTGHVTSEPEHHNEVEQDWRTAIN